VPISPLPAYQALQAGADGRISSWRKRTWTSSAPASPAQADAAIDCKNRTHDEHAAGLP
jgi:hypothetical protein